MLTRKKLMIFMNLKEKLTACMEDAIAREEVAGASMLVLRHGGEVVYAAAGMADREAGKPMARDTIPPAVFPEQAHYRRRGDAPGGARGD